jgi:hypothetical protein
MLSFLPSERIMSIYRNKGLCQGFLGFCYLGARPWTSDIRLVCLIGIVDMAAKGQAQFEWPFFEFTLLRNLRNLRHIDFLTPSQ